MLKKAILISTEKTFKKIWIVASTRKCFYYPLALNENAPVLRADNLAAFTKYGWETFRIILELRKLFDIKSELRIIDFLICESLQLDLFRVIIKITNDCKDDSSDDKEDSYGDRPTSVPEAPCCYPAIMTVTWWWWLCWWSWRRNLWWWS